MADKKNQKLPPVNQLDTVSPATRLLEKRRLMYEKQDQYDQEKKKFKTNELDYKEREKQLRVKDQDIQTSMIQFASYLDGNQKTMKKCDENIAKLKEEITEKEKEIAKKTKMLDILKLKAERIHMQKEADDQYHQYLEEVKEANADYTEIFEITTRYYTLADQQELLENTVQQKDQELSDLKRKIAEYEKEMETKLLGLNVENGHLSNKFNNIDKEKTQLKMQEEENSSKKLSKQRELSMILMAIDNLAEACENRKPNVHKTQFDKKNLVFDFSKERLELAFMQLAEIRHSLSDFKMITKGFKEEEEKLKKKEREKAQSNNNQDINVQNTN